MADAMAHLTIGCQAAVAVTFARSCAAKVAGRDAFANFRSWLAGAVRVPAALAGPAAAGAVAAEAAAAAALLVPPLVPFGFATAAVLLAVFTAAVLSMMRRRVRVPCRCFGAGTRPPGVPHVVRNLVLLLAAGGGAAMALSGDGPPPAGAAAVLAAVAGAAAALLLIDLEEIVDLVRPLAATSEETP
ncbi:MauE/DoxX family redox-associated membrane protein [Spirillospora sp. NPDC029432]|uniref:MauE/DoxX family redox-associated membrane protein n=1 Tax=Spirillospora sp. NPDC029432 TaxID=3154599 RepID=UPI003455A4F8